MISDFLKNIAGNPLKLSGGPLAAIPQILKGIDKSYSPVKDLSGLVDSVAGSGVADSWLNSQTGAGPTGVQQWQANREDTAYQRATEDMKAAGLNPAIMYGNGASPSASTAGSSNGAGLSLSDMLELMTLPAKIENLKADTQVKQANEKNIQQRTLTEEQNTRLKQIMVEWQPAINAETVAKLSAEVDSLDMSIKEKRANIDFLESKEDAQRIINRYLPEKLRSEIDSNNARASQAAASASFVSIQAKFAAEHGVLMSSNDFVVLASYLGHLFGTSPEQIVENVSRYVKEEMPVDFQPWKKVSPDDAMSWFLKHSSSATPPQ